MAAPKPERIVELLEEISTLVEPTKGRPAKLRGLVVEIEEGYRWLFGATHAQTQHSGERVRGGSGPGSGGPTAAVGTSGKGERVLAGRRITTLHSSTQDYARRKQESAGELIAKGVAAFRGAANELSRAFAAIDEDAARREPHGDPIPSQEEPWEIDRARGAQARRVARDEVYAEDALPRPDVEYPTHRFAGKGTLCRDCGESRVHPAHDTPEIQAWRAFMEFVARRHGRTLPTRALAQAAG